MKKCLLLLCIAFFGLIYGCNASANNLINVDSSKVSHISIEYTSQSASADITDSQIMKDVVKSLDDVQGKEIKIADIREAAFVIQIFQNDGAVTEVTFGVTADNLRACRTGERSYQLEEKGYNYVVSAMMHAMRAWCTQLIPAQDVPLADNGVLTRDMDAIVFSCAALDSIKRVKVLDCPPNKVLELDEKTQNNVIASLRTLSFASGIRLPFSFVLKPSPRYRIELCSDVEGQNVAFTIGYYEEKSGFSYAVMLPDKSLSVLMSKTGLPAFR